jgi:hypothetical protein
MAELSPEWVSSLHDYLQDFKEEAYLGAGRAAETLLEQTREEARSRPGWDTLADNIEVWSEDGELIIGVHDNALTSQAFALEYGDENNAPNPLFRKINHIVDEAGQTYMNHMADRGLTDR